MEVIIEWLKAIIKCFHFSSALIATSLIIFQHTHIFNSSAISSNKPVYSSISNQQSTKKSLVLSLNHPRFFLPSTHTPTHTHLKSRSFVMIWWDDDSNVNKLNLDKAIDGSQWNNILFIKLTALCMMNVVPNSLYIYENVFYFVRFECIIDSSSSKIGEWQAVRKWSKAAIEINIFLDWIWYMEHTLSRNKAGEATVIRICPTVAILIRRQDETKSRQTHIGILYIYSISDIRFSLKFQSIMLVLLTFTSTLSLSPHTYDIEEKKPNQWAIVSFR